jgi:ATP-dependent protease ClpP protease subunit
VEHPTTAKTAYVIFSAEIIPTTAESLTAAMSKLASEGVEEVYLALSTPGGSVMHGLTLYTVLRAMPFRLTTHNAGSVNSIGNAVFLAGETRYASPHATFMFHGVGFDAQQGLRLEEKFLRERLEGILADQTRIGAIIQERTQLTAEQVEGLFREAQTKDAAYAASTGIVDEVRDLQIPQGATIVSLVFQR